MPIFTQPGGAQDVVKVNFTMHALGAGLRHAQLIPNIPKIQKIPNA